MDRPEFRAWVDAQVEPNWRLMPLTHVTKGIHAGDIIREGKIDPAQCDDDLAYFFYGRPSYRVAGDGAIKVEAACPFCFVFDADLIKRCREIYPFDTGAFGKRMYKHALMDEMSMTDFSLERDYARANKIVLSVFGDREKYFNGQIEGGASRDDRPPEWEFHANAYLQLMESHGRNEPDDRICSIEITFGDPVPLAGHLKAVVVPHTVWRDGHKAPWLVELENANVEVVPYQFFPGRTPDYYYALLEGRVRDLYTKWGDI